MHSSLIWIVIIPFIINFYHSLGLSTDTKASTHFWKLLATLKAPKILSGKLPSYHITVRHLSQFVNTIYKTSYIRFNNHMIKITVRIQCSLVIFTRRWVSQTMGKKRLSPVHPTGKGEQCPVSSPFWLIFLLPSGWSIYLSSITWPYLNPTRVYCKDRHSRFVWNISKYLQDHTLRELKRLHRTNLKTKFCLWINKYK